MCRCRVLGPGVHACTIGSTHSALRSSAACIQVRLQPAFWRRYMMPGSSSTRAVSSSQQPAGLPASAQLSTVTPALSGSTAPLQPLAATGQQALNGFRRAPSRKRGRAAAQEQPTGTATLAASTETVPAPTGITPAEPASALPTKDKIIKSVEASMSASSEDAVLDPEQAANGNRRNPRRRPQQTKTVATKEDVLPEEVAVKSEVLPDKGMQPASVSAGAGNCEEEGLTQASRKPRRTGKALPTVKAEEPAAAMRQEDQAALKQEDQAALKQEDPAVREHLGSALHVSSKPSDTPAPPSAAEAPAAGLADKPKRGRKAQQSKAAVGVSAADQNGDTTNSDAAAAPPASKMSRQKRAKVEKVVADTSAAIALEAATQDPAVAQAPVAGLDEHKPRKRSRPAQKAAPPPTDAADGDVSASEASAAEGDVSASEAPAAESQAGLSDLGSTGEAVAPGQTKKPPRKRASRAKKAAAPDAADGEAGASEAAVGGSDASMSDASVSVEGAAPGSADAAGAGKTSKPRTRAPRAKKAAAPDSAAASTMSEVSEGAPAAAKPARKRGPRKAAAPDGQPSSSETSCDDIAMTGSQAVKRVVKSRRKFKNELTTRLVAAARAALAAPETVEVPPLPVPNLGYACLNSTLQGEKPPVTTNRGAILRTYNEKGLVYISQLALQNCKDLLPIVQWNHEHSIRLFRLSSDLFPWGDSGKYSLEELPDLPEIAAVLAEVGALARLYKQRLTSHPSEFVKMAAQKEDIVHKSIWDLELHSKVFDMLGFEPSMWNKINIHIGGTYGNTPEDKQATMERFIVNFQKLSPNLKKRLAVENDDKATQWSVTDLLPLHDRIGVSVTFDFHHHRFCDGGLTEEQAFKAAIATWPKGVRPQVHWSEEPEDPTKVRRAHSKYIRGPMNLHGHDADVDIMVEAKAKELTVLDFRNTAHLDVSLPTVAGTLDTQELVRTEYEAHISDAQKARLAVEAAEIDNAAKRAEEAAAAEAAGATKFL